MARTTSTIYKKKTDRHRIANQRRNNHRNRMGYKRRKIKQGFLWALEPKATDQLTRLNTDPNRAKLKLIN